MSNPKAKAGYFTSLKPKAQQNYGHITALRLIPYLLENPTSLCLKKHFVTQNWWELTEYICLHWNL